MLCRELIKTLLSLNLCASFCLNTPDRRRKNSSWKRTGCKQQMCWKKFATTCLTRSMKSTRWSQLRRKEWKKSMNRGRKPLLTSLNRSKKKNSLMNSFRIWLSSNSSWTCSMNEPSERVLKTLSINSMKIWRSLLSLNRSLLASRR